MGKRRRSGIGNISDINEVFLQPRLGAQVDTLIELLTYLFYGTGAVLSWLAKGRRTSLEVELSDTYRVRNGSIAAILWVLLMGIVVYVNNRPE